MMTTTSLQFYRIIYWFESRIFMWGHSPRSEMTFFSCSVVGIKSVQIWYFLYFGIYVIGWLNCIDYFLVVHTVSSHIPYSIVSYRTTRPKREVVWKRSFFFLRLTFEMQYGCSIAVQAEARISIATLGNLEAGKVLPEEVLMLKLYGKKKLKKEL